jgi:hypothetical protein
VQAVCIAPGAVAVKLFLPFHHICLASVFLDEPADAVAALASAFGAFDAEHVEFSFDVTEDEIGPPRHDGDITVLFPMTICFGGVLHNGSSQQRSGKVTLPLRCNSMWASP